MQGFTGEHRFELLFSFFIGLSEEVVVAKEEPSVQDWKDGC